jgi:hypothetical protein
MRIGFPPGIRQVARRFWIVPTTIIKVKVKLKMETFFLPAYRRGDACRTPGHHWVH